MIWAIYVLPLFALKRKNQEKQNNRPVKSTVTKEMLTVLAFLLSPLSVPLPLKPTPLAWCPRLTHRHTYQLLQLYLTVGRTCYVDLCSADNLTFQDNRTMLQQGKCMPRHSHAYVCLQRCSVFLEKSTDSTWGIRLQKTGGRLLSVWFPGKVFALKCGSVPNKFLITLKQMQALSQPWEQIDVTYSSDGDLGHSKNFSLQP